ncbi:hypothetical protein PAXRUDRAFT_21785 [Paxillus rubicundulus Ve08.2h10]|uniref:Uncharacterized protein n=1 Tax=Paxillus rubicundulus Ve08.2h10 TaxID=930991 RepID=A0A0D0CYQ7_9AGAM|nr:hypothetical protein PAXRUDRAFT_21785 [Paxillus rubicundulus Ve08.2h10]
MSHVGFDFEANTSLPLSHASPVTVLTSLQLVGGVAPKPPSMLQGDAWTTKWSTHHPVILFINFSPFSTLSS